MGDHNHTDTRYNMVGNNSTDTRYLRTGTDHSTQTGDGELLGGQSMITISGKMGHEHGPGGSSREMLI